MLTVTVAVKVTVTSVAWRLTTPALERTGSLLEAQAITDSYNPAKGRAKSTVVSAGKLSAAAAASAFS